MLRYKTDDGYRLGHWVDNQRKTKDTMDPDRRQRLEALPGWSWDVCSDQWEEGFSHLKQFSEREGHCRVPTSYKTDDGYPLGQWVMPFRDRTKNTMDADRRQRLEALPGWSWDALSDKWEEGFSQLKQFSDREGHCRVARGYKTDDGYPLGQWVRGRRQAMITMDLDRRQRLEALRGWSWDPHSDQWEEGFSQLKQFSDREGHCRVRSGYKTDDGYRCQSALEWDPLSASNRGSDSDLMMFSAELTILQRGNQDHASRHSNFVACAEWVGYRERK